MDIFKTAEDILSGKKLSEEDTFCLVGVDLYDLLYYANKIRKKFKGDRINLCSILNAKSGKCPEDCKFCAQSLRYKTGSDEYGLVNIQEMLNSAVKAKESGASGFSIVTSGRVAPDNEEFERICEAVEKIKGTNGLYACVSLGEIDMASLKKLKKAGLKKYHHNLETAKSFFNNICTTHTYEDEVKTVELAKSAGLDVCSGGIFGMGEDWEHRIEFAFALRELNVDSVPLNFLNPIKGTPFENISPLKPLDILRIIAIFRFILPNKDITVCGGREKNLRDLQSWVFYAGANGTMLGNYLTTEGRPAEDDLQLLRDLELNN